MRRRTSRWMLAVLLLGTVVAVTFPAWWVAGSTTDAARDEEAALLRSLAERVLGPDVTLLPGVVPDTVAFVPPVPPDGRLLGSLIRPGVPRAPATTTGEYVEVLLEAPAAPPDLLAFYDAALVAQGFAVAPIFGRQGPGGFLPNPGWVQSPLYCRTEDGPAVTIAIFAADARPADVRVRAEAAPFPPCAGSGPGVLRPPAEIVQLPLLVPPPQTQVTPGSSGAGVRSMEALAETTLSAADLEAFYAAQLEAAGWILRERGGDGPTVWSTWLMPGAGERHGYLSVLAWPPGQNRRHIQLLLAYPELPAPGLP